MKGKLRVVNEKNLEAALRREVARRGGEAMKFTSPQNGGVFDRIVLMPKGQMYFAELKSPGKKLSPLQVAFQKRVTALGFRALVISNQSELDEFLKLIDHEI